MINVFISIVKAIGADTFFNWLKENFSPKEIIFILAALVISGSEYFSSFTREDKEESNKNNTENITKIDSLSKEVNNLKFRINKLEKSSNNKRSNSNNTIYILNTSADSSLNLGEYLIPRK